MRIRMLVLLTMITAVTMIGAAAPASASAIETVTVWSAVPDFSFESPPCQDCPGGPISCSKSGGQPPHCSAGGGERTAASTDFTGWLAPTGSARSVSFSAGTVWSLVPDFHWEDAASGTGCSKSGDKPPSCSGGGGL